MTTRRYVNWSLLERKLGHVPEQVRARHVARLTKRPHAVAGRSDARWEEMTDAEVAEAVGLTEDEVRELEDSCATKGHHHGEAEGSAT